MALNLICNSEDQTRDLSNILQDYDLEDLKIDFNLNNLSPEDAQNFLKELKEIGLEYEKITPNIEENNTNIEEEQDQDKFDPKSLLKPLNKCVEVSFVHNWEGDEDIIIERIEDPEIVYLTRRLYGEAMLASVAKECKIDLKFDENTIEFKGFTERVKRIVSNVTGIYRLRIDSIDLSLIECLGEIPEYFVMLEKLKTKIVIGDNIKDYACSLYICGDDTNSVNECKIELEKILKRIFPLFELSNNEFSQDETFKILDFLKKKSDDHNVRRKYQIGLTEDKVIKKNIFFIFFPCENPEENFEEEVADLLRKLFTHFVL